MLPTGDISGGNVPECNEYVENEVDRSWPGLHSMNTSQTMRSRDVVAQAATHRLIAREPLREAVMRSGRLTQAIAGSNDEVGRTADPPSKLRTWTEDTTMLYDKQCLQRVQRDTTEGRCLEEVCGKNMLDVCCDLAPYATSRWLKLKPDRENVVHSGTGSIISGTNATPH